MQQGSGLAKAGPGWQENQDAAGKPGCSKGAGWQKRDRDVKPEGAGIFKAQGIF
jgi:hypothetical protein